MTLYEPATLATDTMLAALGAGLAWRLGTRTSRENRPARWLARALALTAAVAFLGGSYHGFARNFPSGFAGIWWLVTLFLLCFASAALGLSLIHELAAPRSASPSGQPLSTNGAPASLPALRGLAGWKPALLFSDPVSSGCWEVLIALKLAGFSVLLVAYPKFIVPIADYGTTLLAWLAAAACVRRAWRDWMLGAIAVSLVAALVQQLRLAPAPHFNHNDLYHLIQAVALIAFYRAGLMFGVPGTRCPRGWNQSPAQRS